MKYTKDFARYYISYQDNLSENEKVTLLNFVNESSDIQVKGLLYLGEMYQKQEIVDIITEVNISDLQSKFDKDLLKMKQDFWKATKELKARMKSADYYGKTPIQKHRIWKAKQKILDNKFDSHYSNLKFSFKATKNKLMGIKGDPSIKKGVTKAAAVHGVGSVIVAAAIATASYALYKRFLSKSARACSNKSGAEKTLCMQKYKKQATQARIRNMRSQMKQCDKTKDPGKCKAKTMSTIKHLQSKI